jgi:hypothetical protein
MHPAGFKLPMPALLLFTFAFYFYLNKMQHYAAPFPQFPVWAKQARNGTKRHDWAQSER